MIDPLGGIIDALHRRGGHLACLLGAASNFADGVGHFLGSVGHCTDIVARLRRRRRHRGHIRAHLLCCSRSRIGVAADRCDMARHFLADFRQLFGCPTQRRSIGVELGEDRVQILGQVSEIGRQHIGL